MKLNERAPCYTLVVDVFEFIVELLLTALEFFCDVYGPFGNFQGTSPSWQWVVLVVLTLVALGVWMKADLTGLWVS